MYQIVRLEVDDNGNIVARHPLQPPYELWDDAMALAEFDASRCTGEHHYDNEHECWCAIDAGRSYRFVVKSIAQQEERNRDSRNGKGQPERIVRPATAR
jgi:hypothetical protein